MSEEIEELRDAGLAAMATATTLDELDRAKADYLGKRGAIAAQQRTLGELEPEQRRDLGARINAARDALAEAERDRREELQAARDREVLAAEAVDVTLPPRTPACGSLHPVHETMEAMVDVFVGLGFRAVTGPEVESDWFNFEALNIPADHPARSLHDTIYVDPVGENGAASGDGEGLPGQAAEEGSGVLLRTHTSPVQARTMLNQEPPVYVVVPGRTYRSDTPDATHSPVFHQLEGLAVDTDLSFADLRGTLAAFYRELFGAETEIRLRPSYFPFTEPSCEVDAWHDGEWVEMLGAGMVHPNVLTHVGYDPEQVRGFAFGFGIERVAMLRHGITDLRLFSDNDLRFLRAL
jgi:phenylalanyl-tRNA synthetase alpha chain